MPRTIPWARVLAEGAIIVVSVLVGLGIDAWWDDRSATRDAHVALQGVLAEFQDARDEIARGEVQHALFHRTTTSLREHLLSADLGDTASIPDTLLVSMVIPVWGTDPPTALLAAFVSEGHLAQLGNDELRRLVLRWGPRLDDLRADEMRMRAFFDEEVTPYVSSQGDFSRVWETASARQRLMGMRRYPGGLETSDDYSLDYHSPIPVTHELRNLVTKGVDQLGLLRFQSSQALSQLDLIEEAIQSELSR